MSSEDEEEEEEIYAAPLDIQIEIIKRLPIKSLIKFLSVSKSWKSIIQSSPFIADFNRSHIQPHNQFSVGYRDQNYVNIYDDDDINSRFLQHLKLPRSPHHNLKSIGYSQGLFGFHNYKEDSVFIWNPSIRKSVAIPVPGHNRFSYDFGFTVVCNATEPTIFKITYIPRLQVDFYTLSTRIWTSMSNDPPRESLEFTGTWVVIDRFIHWIAYDEGDHYLILSFDITSQHFTELCLPPTLAPLHPSSLKLLGLSKHKEESLVVLERYESKQEIGVWMTTTDQNPFRKLYTVKPPPYPLILESVLGFRKDGQPIIIMHVCSLRWILFFYKPDSECYKYTGISGKRCIGLAGSYMETLLLLDHY